MSDYEYCIDCKGPVSEQGIRCLACSVKHRHGLIAVEFEDDSRPLTPLQIMDGIISRCRGEIS